MNVFIAYGSVLDQTTALRLQALGAVNGLNVFVPPAYTRSSPVAVLDVHAESNLRSADVVLGIISAMMSESCRQELNAAKALGRKTVVLADPAIAPQLERLFPDNILTINPADAAQAERGIVEFLKQSDLEKTAKTALLGLGTLALGLLIFTGFAAQEK